jgi:hypothetical protein
MWEVMTLTFRIPRRPTVCAVVTLLAAASACSSPNSIPFALTVAVVYGVVSTTSGSPVANANVAASQYFPPCPADATGLGNATTRTDSKGAYRLEIRTPTAPRTMCIAVTVTPASGTAKTVTGAQAQFKPSGSTPYDSVRVDVILP